MSKRIASISLGPSGRDYEFTTHLFGEEIHVQRRGAGGDLDRARDLVAALDGSVDAIALDGMTVAFRIGGRTVVHPQIEGIARAARQTPVVDGTHLKNTMERWAIGQVARRQPRIFRHKRIFVLSGIDHHGVAQVLDGYSHHILFGDPIVHLNLPYALHSFRQLEQYTRLVLPYLCRGPVDRLFPADAGQEPRTPRGAQYACHAAVIVGDAAVIRRLAPGDLPD